MDSILKHVIFAIKKYGMIKDGDTVAISLSGGKDSLVLLLAMFKIQKYYEVKFNIKAITLDMCFENEATDFSTIEKFCQELNIPYFIKLTSLWDIIFVKRKEKNPCSLCSKMRKGILNEVALKLGCNKIAFGHHEDDAIETIFMNIIYNNKLKCFSPVTYLSNRDITMIRPLVFCEESHIANVASKLNLPIKKNKCIADKNTKRQKMKDTLSFIEKNACKDFGKKFFRSFLDSELSNW